MTKHLQYIDLSLSRIRNFLNSINNIQNKIPNIIHIAGTNGKGSTLSFIKSILEHHNFSVNAFTSPHLVDYNERFYLSGSFITQEKLSEYEQYLSSIEGFKNLSIFEATTAIGFFAFFNNPADYTILETGLGGRLDATNVVDNPILNIITKIDFDHENFLGNTLDKIAYEKAGIIKNNALVLSDYQDKLVVRTLLNATKSNKFILGGRDYNIDTKNKNITYQNHTYDLASLGLNGEHQLYNSALSLVSALNLPNIKLNPTTIQKALNSTFWAGRLQKVNSLYDINLENSEIYLDGAHNVSGINALKNFILSKLQINPNLTIHIIFGMLKTKNLTNCLLQFKNIDLSIYPLDFSQNNTSYYDKCFSIQDISNVCKELNLNYHNFNNIKEILNYLKIQNGNKLIIICGSLYMLGSILSNNRDTYKINFLQ